IDEIKKSGISEIEYERWLERKKLDREISISKEIQMLKDVGFRNVECIYSKGKFGVIVSIK
ncbi:MAG: class I SAM-dependent methyltransferase, partial [Treponema sp.]|nr:class I SAM-dependent methyltransferase [Treponema sp.]